MVLRLAVLLVGWLDGWLSSLTGAVHAETQHLHVFISVCFLHGMLGKKRRMKLTRRG